MSTLRTSYLPCEIVWGHRFEQMQLYRKDNNKFEINFSAFHSTYEVSAVGDPLLRHVTRVRRWTRRATPRATWTS